MNGPEQAMEAMNVAVAMRIARVATSIRSGVPPWPENDAERLESGVRASVGSAMRMTACKYLK